MPGTRLDIRLDENNIPKLGEEPINAIDHCCSIKRNTELCYTNRLF